MEGFKSQKKIACFKEGGQVGYKSRKNHSEEKEMSADIKQDKAIVKKGVAQHEAAKHKGEPKTELKLKTGGRAKKEKGTVKKYCGGGMTKKADGGIIDRLTKNVMGTEAQNEAAKKSLNKVAEQDTMVGALERGARKAATALKGQGAVSDAERKTMESAVPRKKGGKC